jgi:hypothetical protein
MEPLKFCEMMKKVVGSSKDHVSAGNSKFQRIKESSLRLKLFLGSDFKSSLQKYSSDACRFVEKNEADDETSWSREERLLWYKQYVLKLDETEHGNDMPYMTAMTSIKDAVKAKRPKYDYDSPSHLFRVINEVGTERLAVLELMHQFGLGDRNAKEGRSDRGNDRDRGNARGHHNQSDKKSSQHHGDGNKRKREETQAPAAQQPKPNAGKTCNGCGMKNHVRSECKFRPSEGNHPDFNKDGEWATCSTKRLYEESDKRDKKGDRYSNLSWTFSPISGVLSLGYNQRVKSDKNNHEGDRHGNHQHRAAAAIHVNRGVMRRNTDLTGKRAITIVITLILEVADR